MGIKGLNRIVRSAALATDRIPAIGTAREAKYDHGKRTLQQSFHLIVFHALKTQASDHTDYPAYFPAFIDGHQGSKRPGYLVASLPANDLRQRQVRPAARDYLMRAESLPAQGLWFSRIGVGLLA